MPITSETTTVKKFVCDNCSKEIPEEEAKSSISVGLGCLLPWGNRVEAVVDVSIDNGLREMKENVVCDDCKIKILESAIGKLKRKKENNENA